MAMRFSKLLTSELIICSPLIIWELLGAIYGDLPISDFLKSCYPDSIFEGILVFLFSYS